MIAGIQRTVDPSVAAIALADVKAYLRITDSDSDAILTSRIEEATDIVEHDTGRALIDQTYRAVYDGIGCQREFILPRPPIQSITTLEYRDTDGAWQELSSALYDLDTDREPGLVRIRSGSIPTVSSTIKPSYKITYVAGYGAASTDIPAGLRSALLVIIAAMHDDCDESRIERVINPIVARYRVPRMTLPRNMAGAV